MAFKWGKRRSAPFAGSSPVRPVTAISPKPRVYRTKAKNAQEAHEAIRPTDPAPAAGFAAGLSDDDLKLYELIWKRAVASQMASAELDQTAVTIETAHRRAQVRATGSVVVFDGFLKHVEDRDERASDDGDDNGRLLPVGRGDALALQEINPEQHFTQPPPATARPGPQDGGTWHRSTSTYASVSRFCRTAIM